MNQSDKFLVDLNDLLKRSESKQRFTQKSDMIAGEFYCGKSLTKSKIKPIKYFRTPKM